MASSADFRCACFSEHGNTNTVELRLYRTLTNAKGLLSVVLVFQFLLRLSVPVKMSVYTDHSPPSQNPVTEGKNPRALEEQLCVHVVMADVVGVGCSLGHQHVELLWRTE